MNISMRSTCLKLGLLGGLAAAVTLLRVPGALATPEATGEIHGRVYLDRNANGNPDADEPGIAAVLVSDGVHVVATDASGRYRLPVGQAPVLLALGGRWP